MTKQPDSTHPNANAFPAGLSGPALRALAHAGIRTMAQLAQWTERDVGALHGMGPKGVRILREALAVQRRHFRRPAD
jgi:predicted flap endonuclease-1-like 5' DNA nuclease